MKELAVRIEQLERRIAEKEDEIQLLKDDLDALRAALEAAISEQEQTEPEQTSQPQPIQEEATPEIADEDVTSPSEEALEVEEEEDDTEQLETATISSSAQATDEEVGSEEETEEEQPADPEPDHEAIMRTIEAFANKKPSPAASGDQWSEKETIGDRAASTSLNDIRKAMGLNERFLYANELFQGDMSAFTKAVEELNHLDSLADAEKMMEEELAIRFQWDDENDAVTAFKTLVSRRFA